MASEWRSGTLNDVANIKTGKLDSNHATVGGQYPFFTCAPEPLQIGSYAFDDDAIILAGNNANGIFHLNRYTGKFNAYQRTYVLTAKNPTQVDLDYLFYTLTTLTRRLEEFSQGTATKFLTKTILTSLPIALPSLTEQRAIGMLLRCLDNGIRSRLTQNECLESVASAIFKSWFVDFDPVRAKAEEREPEGMDAATAALFPDELEDGPSGRVPKGWKMSPITVLANIVYGAPFASNSFSSSRIGVPLVRIRDLKTMQPTVFTNEVHPKGYLVSPGDVVIGMDGEFRAYYWLGEPSWLNQRICAFIPKVPVGRVFVREALIPLLDAVERGQVGTTVIHIGKADIDRFNVLLPSEPVLSVFNGLAENVLNQVIANTATARTLSELRDTLLPRLISGKLRVPEAEKLMEAVL